MPNHQSPSSPRASKSPDNHRHVPFHTCIRLEDSSQARTSSIDAEWETLSALPTQSRALPTVSARPRIETLPGIGIIDLPAVAIAVAKPQRSTGSRLLISVLAAMLASSLAFVGISTWQGQRADSSPQPASVAVALAPEPAPHPLPAHSLSLPLPVALAARASATSSDTEPAPLQSTHQSEQPARSAPSALRPSGKVSVPRALLTGNFRARKVALAATDNPY